MINIILLGDLNDTSVSEVLSPALARYGGVKYVSQNILYESSAEPEFLLLDCEMLPKLEIKGGILLFKNSVPEQKNFCIPNGFVNIMESKNARAAAMLQKAGASAVTCGSGPKDTLSIAGLENNAAALSLQRNLKILNGNILEPRDFNVKFAEKRSPHQILSTCAVLLAAGVDPSQGYAI